MNGNTSSGLSADTVAKIEQEIMKLETEIKAAKSLTDPKAAVAYHEGVYADGLIDIHASGWIYTREQSIDLEKNMAATPRDLKPIKSTVFDHHIRVLSETVVAVTGLIETYFEAANPMQQSLKAGTFTMAPEALTKANAAPPPFGPGEELAPNPYRTRITRIWVKQGDTWKLALSQATRLGKRVRIGY